MAPTFIHLLTLLEVYMIGVATGKTASVEMTHVKETPNMQVFKCTELAVMTSIYVHNSFAKGVKKIKVTVEVLE